MNAASRNRPATAKTSRRAIAEEQICRRREREAQQKETWNGLTRYYHTFETANNKFEEWTSPRYYETNNQMMQERKTKQEKAEALEKRRDKLRKLLREEEDSYQIVLTVKNRDKLLTTRSKFDSTPIELLRDVNLGLKVEEEDRRRHEAELGLYHQWRRDNPLVRLHERSPRNRDLKLSWLDQQVEKRMREEKEKEECQKILAEREKRLEKLRLEEEEREKEATARKQRLKEEIEAQIEEVKRKQAEGERLKKEEDEKLAQQAKLLEIEEKRKKEAEKRANYEIALHNVRHYKMRLKQKAQQVQKDLEYETELIEQIVRSKLAEAIEEQTKRREMQKVTEEFLELIRHQRELEKKREKQMDFIFDSEAKYMYERQDEIWNREKNAREALLRDVLETIKKQIEDKVREKREKQKQILEERRANLELIEQYNKELLCKQEEEERKKMQRKMELDAQVKEKNALKRKLKTFEQQNIDKQIEETRKEEERLRREILNLQKRQDNLGWARNNKKQLFLC